MMLIYLFNGIRWDRNCIRLITSLAGEVRYETQRIKRNLVCCSMYMRTYINIDRY